MENRNPNTEKNIKIYKISIAILLVIIAVLAFLLIRSTSQVSTIVVEKEKSVQMNMQMQHELDSLIAEHNKIKNEYGYISGQLSEKDSMIMAQAKEIEQLIASQADYRRVKKKLDQLRNITQGYVSQIDSLYRVNKQLTDENVKIKGDLESEQKKSFELNQDKENLKTKINDAAVLRAYNVSVSALNVKSGSKETATDRAKKTDKFKVCFTIGENRLVETGNRNVYLRIARPNDNLILTQGSYVFTFNGKTLQYSEKTALKYNGQAVNACIEYTRGDVELKAGKYYFTLYTDNAELGEASITLK